MPFAARLDYLGLLDFGSKIGRPQCLGGRWRVNGRASKLDCAILSPKLNFRAGVTNFGEQKLTWFSTTRGRAGFTITDNLLLYGTGGLAAGRASASSSFLLTGCGGIGNCVAGSDTKTLWGWTAGGGLEYGIGHWSMRVEYLHYDLGHLNYNMTDPTAPAEFIAASTKFSGDIIRGGVNYRFDWTPWELIFGRHS